HEGVGDLAWQRLPVLAVLRGEDLGELGDGEVGEVCQAGRVVDDEGHRHATAGIEYLDSGGPSRGPRAGLLGQCRYGECPSEPRAEHGGAGLQELTTCRADHRSAPNGTSGESGFKGSRRRFDYYNLY